MGFHISFHSILNPICESFNQKNIEIMGQGSPCQICRHIKALTTNTIPEHLHLKGEDTSHYKIYNTIEKVNILKGVFQEFSINSIIHFLQIHFNAHPILIPFLKLPLILKDSMKTIKPRGYKSPYTKNGFFYFKIRHIWMNVGLTSSENFGNAL